MAEAAEFKPEGISPPAFWNALKESDAAALAAQNKGRAFGEADVLAVARRCRFGFPQVVVSAPLSRGMKPFPTLFWLTCPFLKRRCGELESMQKIAELEKLFASMPDDVARYPRGLRGAAPVADTRRREARARTRKSRDVRRSRRKRRRRHKLLRRMLRAEVPAPPDGRVARHGRSSRGRVARSRDRPARMFLGFLLSLQLTNSPEFYPARRAPRASVSR